MRVFETDKYERYTELGMAIDKFMTQACKTAFAVELANGASCRVAMARVARNNPFTLENIRLIVPDTTGITQDELDCVWMLCAFDISMEAIL